MGKRFTTPTTDAEAASLTVSKSNRQTAFAKHQSWPMVKPVLLATLVCAVPVCQSSAQDAKVSVDMMGIGGMSCLLAVYSSTSTGGNNLDLWILDGTQLRCRSERTDRDESRHRSGNGRGQENMRSAPVAGTGQRRVDRLS
jgi:hypothetical protein